MRKEERGRNRATKSGAKRGPDGMTRIFENMSVSSSDELEVGESTSFFAFSTGASDAGVG